MEKRNTAVDLTDLALGLIILGITVTIGASIMMNMRDNRLTDLDTVLTTNETVDINNTGDTLATSLVAKNYFAGIITCACNGSGIGTGSACPANNTLLTSANYTVSVNAVNGGVATMTSATVENYTGSICNYTTYNTSRADYDLPNQTALGLGEFGNWFDIIVIVGIAGLILSLIFLAFGNRGQGSGTEISY